MPQGPRENPSTFFERVFEAYQQHIDIYPEHSDNMKLVNMTLISQSTPDIRKNLQKLERGLEMPMFQLVEIALKCLIAEIKFRKCRSNTTCEDKLLCLQQHSAKTQWAVHRKEQMPMGKSPNTLTTRPKRPSICDTTKGALCGQEGHWKRNCPNLPWQEGTGTGSKSSCQMPQLTGSN